MGYQALLFCPDEKLATVVNQVFRELDFTIEAANEPFGAVKKLMAQRFDAIVVDSENEQNASLLFKSARNSSFNQGSLAIALVEGQIGVAKAYRMGANLVLTKPINVEQAKGTLRVARGLLRKNPDAAAAAANTVASAWPSKSAPARTENLIKPANNKSSEMAPPLSISPESNDSEVNSDIAFLANLAEKQGIPAVVRRSQITVPTAQPVSVSQPSPVGATESVVKSQPVPSPAPQVTFSSTNSVSSLVTGSAAAPAPAKEAPAERRNRIVEAEPLHSQPDTAPDAITIPYPTSRSAADAPSFAALDADDSLGSGGNKKYLIAAVIAVALAAVGYLGYGKYGKSSTNISRPPVVSAPSDSDQPAPALRPMSSPAPPPSKSAPNSTNFATQTSPSKMPSTGNPSSSTVIALSPAIRTSANSEVEAKEPAPAPILVKSAAGTKAHAHDDESAPPMSPSVAEAANDTKLTGLMSSVSSSLPTPTLATLKISQGVSQGLLIKRVTPTYPRSALAVHTQGTVLIEATITRDGTVTNLKVLNGDPVLSRAAIDAVRQWRYKPYYLDGVPVEIQTQITVNFKAN